MKQSESGEQHSITVEEQESQEHLQKHTINRRQFLIGAVIAGGVAGTALVIGFNVFGRHGKTGTAAPGSITRPNSFAPDIWVRLDADNTVTIQVARSEVGQGVLTALAMLLAEEMDADWATVRVEQALADAQYGDQKTDGSSSVSDSFYTMRSVGAQARAFLVSAAAQIWGVHQSTCRTEKGVVISSSQWKAITLWRPDWGRQYDQTRPRDACWGTSETNGTVHTHRDAGTTSGYTPKNRWKRHLWPGCPVARDALCDHCPLPNFGWHTTEF